MVAAPGLVVVSGAPGTGKSTVATALATALSRPLLGLDDVKEALADRLGARRPGTGDEDWSDQLGDAAAEILFRLARIFPVGSVVEGWWRRERRDRALVEFAGAFEVFCRCTPALAEQRMRERHRAARHPIHRDVINPALLDSVHEVAAAVEPLDLGGGLVVVDTTDGSFDTEGVVAAVRAALGPPAA